MTYYVDMVYMSTLIILLTANVGNFPLEYSSVFGDVEVAISLPSRADDATFFPISGGVSISEQLTMDAVMCMITN